MKNLSPRASRLVNGLSQNIAREFYSVEIQPEHILLAMINTREGVGYYALKKSGIDIDSFSISLEQKISGGNERHHAKTENLIPLGKRAEKLIEKAAEECETLKDKRIGTEHILLSAIEEESSAVSLFFAASKISIGTMRNLVKITQEEHRSSEDIISNIENISGEALRKIFGNLGGNEERINRLISSQPLENQETGSSGKFSPQVSGNLQKTQSQQKGSGQKSERKENRSFLSEFSRDITQSFRDGKADIIVGREKEINRLVQILSRRTKNNPVLVGEPGIGKTAIVEGLAQAIALKKVPSGLLKKRILSLDLAALIAGTKFRGEFEERMKKMMNEVREDRNIILFIDELHTIIGAGGPEGTMDASNMLKPALSRSEIQIIGATTTKEYSRYIEKDSALERRFQMVKVEEPTDEDSILILEGIKKQYEDFHGVVYEDDVIPSIVKLSRRYIPERFLPDKAIDILDEAGAQKKIQEDREPTELLELEKQIDALVDEKSELVKNQDYENAAFVRDKVVELKRQFEVYSSYWKEKGFSERVPVNSGDISRIISEMTGIPLEQLDKNESKRLVEMESEMHRSVVGQDEAVHIISGAVRRSRAGISSPKRPIGSFIFLGPTGVGKTQLAKALSKFMFGSEDLLIRIDMSDFMEKHNASRLVGAPPGYVGYEDGGVLTEQVRRHPYSVVLLDEIEKAHPDVFNLLLQILEEGELSDNLGHTVNFRNTVIIMTSNAGSGKITSESQVGFSANTEKILPYEEIKMNAESELKKILSPELINRIDDVIVFKALSRGEISQILDIQLNELKSRLSEHGFSLSLTEDARSYLIEKGYEPSMGARPMRRLIQKEIEDPLSLEILEEKNRGLCDISVGFENGSLEVAFLGKKDAAENKDKADEKNVEENPENRNPESENPEGADGTEIKCTSLSGKDSSSRILTTVNILEKK